MSVHIDVGSAQFENVNSLRSYPFAEGSSLVDRFGKELSRDVVVDAHLVVPFNLNNPSSGFSEQTLPAVRLSAVHLSASTISACFVAEINGTRNALSVTVLASDFKPYYPYRLEKLAGSEDIGGIVTFGNMTFPGFGETYFLPSAIIHPCCVTVARPVSLRKFIDLRSGESVTGDAEIAFSGYVKTSRNGNSVRVSLEDGADVELASECAKAVQSNACGATPIRSINGISPDEDGNIVLWFH